MTSEPPAGPSAAKLGGYVLIGIGALAAVFGVGTAMSGETHNTAQPPGAPASSQASQPPLETGAPKPPAPSSESAPPPPPETSAPQVPPRPQVPSQPQAPPQPPRQQVPEPPRQQVPEPPRQQVPEPPADSRVVLRVYNNSMIRGLAHRAAADFRAAGYKVAEIGNYSGGRIATTTVYYRPGTPEQAQAEAVAQRFGARMEPRFPGIEQASPGVIAIITKSYDGPEPGK